MWIIKTVFADCIVFQLIICSLWVFISLPTVSVQFSCSAVSDSLWPHEPQHSRPPCPSPSPRVYSNSCPLSWWCHPTISSSVIPFSSCLRSFSASGSFQVSQFFVSGGQSTGVSASASRLPIQLSHRWVFFVPWAAVRLSQKTHSKQLCWSSLITAELGGPLSNAGPFTALS